MILFNNKRNVMKKLKKSGFIFLEETDKHIKFYDKENKETIFYFTKDTISNKPSVTFHYESTNNDIVIFDVELISNIYDLIKIITAEIRESIIEDKLESRKKDKDKCN